MHLIRAALRYVSYTDRKAVAAGLRVVYTAATEVAALEALAAFSASELGARYPGAAAVFERA